MSFAFAGALATALAVICLLFLFHPIGPRIATGLVHPEHSVLREAGWTRSLLVWECLRGAVICCGLVLASALGAMPLGLASAAAPSIVARSLAARTRERKARETVALLQMTLAALRSNASLIEALRLATSVGREEVFAGAVRAFDLGAPLDLALRAARIQALDPRVVLGLEALSLCVAERLPAARSAALIASTVERLVFEQRLVDEMRSRTSGLQAQIVLLAALVPALTLYLWLTLPGMQETLGTPLGRFVLLPTAAVFEATGLLLSRRVVQGLL